MLQTKSKFISGNKAVAEQLLKEIQYSGEVKIYDNTISNIMSVYETCLADCMKSTTFRKAKKSRDLLVLVALLRASAGFLLGPDTDYYIIDQTGNFTDEGLALYELYDILIDYTFNYAGFNMDLSQQHLMVEKHIENQKQLRAKW